MRQLVLAHGVFFFCENHTDAFILPLEFLLGQSPFYLHNPLSDSKGPSPICYVTQVAHPKTQAPVLCTMNQKQDWVAAAGNILKRYGLILVGVALGAVGGYLYYHFVGCASGSCAITSSPVNSTLYGAVMGGLLLNIFRTKN